MKYKIVVDKQSRLNPSTEKREYEIDIEELHCKGDVYDSLIITKDEDYVLRRIAMSKFHVLSVLEEPIKEPIADINIELFEGENYIYLTDMIGNKFYAEYLVNNDLNNIYVNKNEMNSAIYESAKEIDLSVNQKLTKYSTSEEMNALIQLLSQSILLEVSKKLNNKDFTAAQILLKINNDTSEALIKADKINLNGAISANGNFKISTDGNMECNNGKFNGGTIRLQGGTGSSDAKFIIEDINNSSIFAYLTPNSIQMGDSSGNGDSFNFNSGIFKLKGSESFFEFYGNSKEINTDATICLLNSSGSYTTEITSDYIKAPILTQTSLKTEKKNFERLENALDIIKNVDIYKYNLKNEDSTTKKHIGFVIGQDYKYSKELTNKENDGVDIYSLASCCLQAIKEQQKQIEIMSEEIKQLKEAK